MIQLEKKKIFQKQKNVKFVNNIKRLCKETDLLILHTEWDEFKSLDFKKLTKGRKFILYDLRNLYSPKEMNFKKIKYFSIGRSTAN